MKQLDEWLWNSRWYPFLWDYTCGPFFRLYNSWKFKHELRKMFGGKIPEVGDRVCTCSYEHGVIVEKSDFDSVVVLCDDGVRRGCSLYNCCDRIDHEWEHPSTQELEEWRTQTQKEIN